MADPGKPPFQQTLENIRAKVEKLPEIPLRRACVECGETIGRIRPTGNQDCVFCRTCGKFQFNAPRTETGREIRSLGSSRHVPVSRRNRIIERAHGRCETCGKLGEGDLQAGHVLSRKDGFDFVTDAQLDSDENLIAQCPECNSGQGLRTLPLWLLAGILYRRTAK